MAEKDTKNKPTKSQENMWDDAGDDGALFFCRLQTALCGPDSGFSFRISVFDKEFLHNLSFSSPWQ